MESLTENQLSNFLLTKAMADYSVKEERFNSLNDVIDEVFEDGAIDRDEYLHSIMKLTQLGFISSDIQTEEDIELSEAGGYEINGLTAKGLEYINKLSEEPTLKNKVKTFFQKFNEVCDKVNENPVVKLAGATLVPILDLFI